MAIAGKVAITLSTENGGAWSADVTYDRLVAVKHNNNLYISRKTVANVEPPNDEFWFLALEGFGGEDVEALIDRLNEMSDLIQAIIDGTTQVGNAKTLDGHEAEYFATAVDLSNYLPKSGGTVNNLEVSSTAINSLVINRKNDGGAVTEYKNVNGVLGGLGFDSNGIPSYRATDGSMKALLHTGNKPTGTYTGNGSATQRDIAVGGIGNCVLVWKQSGGAFAIVTRGGYVGRTATGFIGAGDALLMGTNLIISTTSQALNENGVVYEYRML